MLGANADAESDRLDATRSVERVRPYRFQDERQSASGRWEMWVDSAQARAIRAARSG